MADGTWLGRDGGVGVGQSHSGAGVGRIRCAYMVHLLFRYTVHERALYFKSALFTHGIASSA